MEPKHQRQTGSPKGPYLHWRSIPCLHHEGYTCQEIEQRTIFVSWNIVLFNMPLDILSASQSINLPRNRVKDNLCFLEHCSLRHTLPFLLRLTLRLQACSIPVTFLLAAAMTLEGTLIKTICHVDLPCYPESGNCAKYFSMDILVKLLQLNIPHAGATKMMFML